MSDSEEDAVRRPGRAGASHQSPAPSDNDSGDNKDLFGDDQMDEDNDADLFGSDGEDGGADNEYGIPSEVVKWRKALTNRQPSSPHLGRRTIGLGR
jgi:hypothetical protein